MDPKWYRRAVMLGVVSCVVILVCALMSGCQSVPQRWGNSSLDHKTFDQDDGECQALTPSRKEYRKCMRDLGWHPITW